MCPVCRMLFYMFRAPLRPSSGAQEYYTVVAACGTWRFGLQVVGLVWCGAVGYVSGLRVISPEKPDQRPVNQSAKYQRQQTSVQILSCS